MRIQPVDEASYSERQPWPRGWYACVIRQCAEGRSQAGNGYFKCEVEVTDAGRSRSVTHYIMAEGPRAWQLRAAAEALNLLDAYRKGEIGPDDFRGQHAFAKLGIDEDGQGRFPAKNVILDYAATLPRHIRAARRAKARKRGEPDHDASPRPGVPDD